MTKKTDITAADILDLDDYNAIRSQKRGEITAIKKLRRLAVGPDATFYFECYETMWYRIQEMLRIEKGGEAQLADELAAYSPLVPKGCELVATVMFEINDEARRAEFLNGLGGVENMMVLEIDGETVTARPEEDLDRTNAAGKASSVQFVHFHMSADQVEAFKDPGKKVMLGISHPKYTHLTLINDQSRAELAKDFT
jgi:hypothetical protein